MPPGFFCGHADTVPINIDYFENETALSLLSRPFKGLYEDVKRKLPWYGSDFKDAIHIQCLPATLFIFLATLTNNVTFGALLGQGTGNYMVSWESPLFIVLVLIF
jgi:hypothetical protein